MSEFQYVGFRAVDQPLNEKQLEYMERQSTRAEITTWSFDNEYHYGDFRGNAAEMLRRGYDIHLHYANFGVRTLMIRLPHGLPDASAAKPYLIKDGFYFQRDKSGPGGILCLEPYHEPGDQEELWDLEEWIEDLIPLRGEIQRGDLRPFYLARLACCLDIEHNPEKELEGPVPAGLGQLTRAQRILAQFYELSDSLLAAAAQAAPDLPSGTNDPSANVAKRIQGLPIAKKNEWLTAFVTDSANATRAKFMAEFQAAQKSSIWETTPLERKVSELLELAEQIQKDVDKKKCIQAATKRKQMLSKMQKDPQPTLKQTEQLVAERSTSSYQKAAKLLLDLQEALAGTKQANLALQQAGKLRQQFPTRRTLISELRKQGLLPK